MMGGACNIMRLVLESKTGFYSRDFIDVEIVVSLPMQESLPMHYDQDSKTVFLSTCISLKYHILIQLYYGIFVVISQISYSTLSLFTFFIFFNFCAFLFFDISASILAVFFAENCGLQHLCSTSVRAVSS